MPRVGRPPKCGGCGECDRCKRAAYMREWWRALSPERKREYLDRRQELRGEKIRERDRERWYPGRKKPRAPEKRRAQWTVANALRDKRLFRQPCEVCGEEEVQAHHSDYSRPLDVRWLCRKHHMELHRKYPGKAAA